MIDVCLHVALTLEGPVLTRATAPGGYGVDAPHARGHDGGGFILPASLVKGRLLDAWRDLSTAGLAARAAEWLGEETGSRDRERQGRGSSPEPRRGRLRFGDFTAGDRSSGVLFRIRIDADTGAADEGSYQVIESPFAPGELVEFAGDIRFIATDATEADQIERNVRLGLEWTSAMGAFGSIGFGRVHDVGIKSTKAVLRIDSSATGSGNTLFDLILTPKAPFCVSRNQPDGNLFESDGVIPGAVLRGCLASLWAELVGSPPGAPVPLTARPEQRDLARQLEPLGRNLEHVRFSHAFPASGNDANVRPVRPPLSLVMAAGRLWDVAACEGPGLVCGEAPAFAVDWKDRDDVDGEFGWPRLRRELRVRTAIDPARRSAAEGKLFAHEMVVPQGRPWLGRVDLSRVPPPERGAVESGLRVLLGLGVRGLGKTKVAVGARLEPAGTVRDAIEREPLPGVHIVTLQTPALLCDPELLDEASDDARLFDAYAATWRELSGGALELSHYLASQSLAGGYYLHRRFRGHMPYVPWLLTDPGSVFVLKPAAGRDKDSSAAIEEWAQQGLDIPTWAKARYERGGKLGDHWSNCPFIPENGYGEVVVDLAVHASRKPEPNEFERISLLGRKP